MWPEVQPCSHGTAFRIPQSSKEQNHGRLVRGVRFPGQSSFSQMLLFGRGSLDGHSRPVPRACLGPQLSCPLGRRVPAALGTGALAWLSPPGSLGTPWHLLVPNVMST